MSIVVKEQLCGNDCEGCPHGPYKWRVTSDGTGGQNWEYLGKSSEVDRSGEDYTSEFVDGSDVNEPFEDVSDIVDDIETTEDGRVRATMELDDNVDTEDLEIVVGEDEAEFKPGTLRSYEIDPDDADDVARLFDSIYASEFDSTGSDEHFTVQVGNRDIVVATDEDSADGPSKVYLGSDDVVEEVDAMRRDQDSELVGPADETVSYDEVVDSDMPPQKVEDIHSDAAPHVEGADPLAGSVNYDLVRDDIEENGIYEDTNTDEKFVYYEGDRIDIDNKEVERLKEPGIGLHDIIEDNVNSSTILAKQI